MEESAQRPVRGAEREVVRDALLGWRAWRVVDGDEGPTLMSWTLDVLWPARRALESHCQIHGCQPVAGHTCGIHAYGDRAEALTYVVRPTDGQPRLSARRAQRLLGLAFGRVSGWGHAVLHTRGWRSQLAYPYELVLLSRDRGLALALAGSYAVETVPAPRVL
jgi:hypothetical protein